jgi:hypothetical protein
MGVLLKLSIFGLLIFLGLCILEIVVAQAISAGLGAVIGAGIGAFVHYCEKTFAQHKMQNQQEDTVLPEAQTGLPTRNGGASNDGLTGEAEFLPPNKLDEAFSFPVFAQALNNANDQLSCTTFCEVLFEDTPFASTPK